MLTHKQIWAAIDGLAARYGLSASGLAKASGLDPTTFNKSKRIGLNGKERWPSTESISKILSATGAPLDEFVSLTESGVRGFASRSVPLIGMAQAGGQGFFDDAGFPAGSGWEEIAYPDMSDEHVYALEIAGTSMLPVYRDGDRIVVSPTASVRRGDRVVIKTLAGEVMAKKLSRQTAQRVELKSFNAEFPERAFAMTELAFMHRILWASQ